MNNIIIKDNLFDDIFVNLFYEFCISNNHWTYGRKSALNKDNLIWGAVLWEPGDIRNVFIEYIFRKFAKTHNIDADVLSCVLNGQTSGQETTWHVDLYDNDNIDDKYTLIYYVNPEWTDDSGSTLIKLNDYSNTTKKVNFVPGRLAFFPSKLQHKAESPIKENMLRITCAYKLRLKGI